MRDGLELQYCDDNRIVKAQNLFLLHRDSLMVYLDQLSKLSHENNLNSDSIVSLKESIMDDFRNLEENIIDIMKEKDYDDTTRSSEEK